MKLRGLHKYLAQNLGLEVAELDQYANLSGSAVTESPAFKDNMLSFGVCYGLCVQGLGLGKLGTNLVPPEIVKDRMIKAKKPWAVAAVASWLLGCTIGYFGKWREWNSAVDPRIRRRDSVMPARETLASSTQTDFEEANTKYNVVPEIGERLKQIGEQRLLWAEMLKAVNECLPHDPPPQPNNAGATEQSPPEIEFLRSERSTSIRSIANTCPTFVADWAASGNRSPPPMRLLPPLPRLALPVLRPPRQQVPRGTGTQPQRQPQRLTRRLPASPVPLHRPMPTHLRRIWVAGSSKSSVITITMPIRRIRACTIYTRR